MIKELNDYLGLSITDDYWYDELLVICNDILLDFSDSDWEELLAILPCKSPQWQKNLIESLAGIDTQFSLRCIFDVALSCDTDLFVICMDIMRDCDIGIMPKNQKLFLLSRAEKEIHQVKGIDKIVLKTVLEKIRATEDTTF